MITMDDVLPNALAASITDGVVAGRFEINTIRRCRNGHPQTDGNIYEWADRQYCRACRREYMYGFGHGERRPYRPTTCPAGHEYDEANTRRWGNRRHCRACDRAGARQRYREEKERQQWTE